MKTYPESISHGSLGLQQDLEIIFEQQSAKRRLLIQGLLLGTTLPILGCGGGGYSSTDSTSGSGTSGGVTSTGSCSVIPTETAGPFPGDGSQSTSLNALILTGIERSDIRSSLAPATGVAGGVPLTVTVKLVSASNNCAVLAGYAIYLWHCSREGAYSMYSSGITSENYLRGVQVTNANGEVTFTTIFPGCYSGRWPHIHFEIYSNLSAALSNTSVSDYVKVSQLALPHAACSTVYNSVQGYTASISNLAVISLASDNVFGSDSAAYQLATVTGSVAAGYVATLTVGI